MIFVGSASALHESNMAAVCDDLWCKPPDYLLFYIMNVEKMMIKKSLGSCQVFTLSTKTFTFPSSLEQKKSPVK